MRKLITLICCAAGFFLIAAPIYMNQPSTVFINGKPFAHALTINGIIAVSVEDFAKAIGGGGTVRVQGNKLAIISPRLEASSSADTFTLTPGSAAAGTPAAATGGGGAGKAAIHEFTITKSSNTASPILMSEGKAFVALADVARLFGGTFNNTITGNLRPGQRIDLNFAPTAGAAITIRQSP